MDTTDMARTLKRRSVRIGPGCQAVRLPTGWWHLRWYDPARTPTQKQHALDTDDEAIALSRSRERFDRQLAGLYDPWRGSGRAVSAEEAVRVYEADHADRHRPKSIRVAAASVRALARSVRPGPEGRWDPAVADSGCDPSDIGIREITSDHVRRFVYRPDLSRASQLSYWRRFRAWFGWAADRQLVDANPVDDVPRPSAVRAGMKHLSRPEIERLLVAIEHHHGPDGPVPPHVRSRDRYPLWARDAFDLYASTGLRRGEGIALRWRDVVYPEDSAWGVGYIRVEDEGRVNGRRTKTGRSRRVTMIPRAEALLRRLEAETRRTSDPDEHILKGADGIRVVSEHTLSHNFRRYRQLAKLPDVPLHGLRHSFAVELLLRGASLIQVRDELGHATVQTTERYLELLPAERARATAALFAGELGT
ncbi:hypothetical protein B1759_15130 [Rubrivirga sp. SAORIC476]|uniref:tyrosine-type recombinase/integrase n=1 Tax=Rubrivirga sp. SAORIC476 TaxID=1961794 RepID=UPI000BA9BBCB|nr:site-specific integrase [Rubrivirga sp. SAORIC476]PAP79650.1 hypothetical protein B1759_15130 [Rubrivirga sp. SAORIC476]